MVSPGLPCEGKKDLKGFISVPFNLEERYRVENLALRASKRKIGQSKRLKNCAYT